MDTFGNAILGIVFLLLSTAGTFLMFYLWGFPFDHEKLKSSAPRTLVMLHHLIGYAYTVIYIYMMWEMVTRLWNYQVEFPARTVAHLMLGITIGIILIVKVAIVRFFKHLESDLVPFLGVGLFVCTFLLVGLSVPFALKELSLLRGAVGGTAFSPENIDRVKMLLPKSGLPAEAHPDDLANQQSLKQGRDVLLTKCVQCHDLRTVLLKPRTPENWVQTVGRMAERSVFNPISNEEQWRVATYLIAISPDLQRGVQQKRQLDVADKSPQSTEGMSLSSLLEAAATKSYDLEEAKETFESTCSQCHRLTNVDKSPPASVKETAELVTRMVENGLKAPQEDLEQIAFYLSKTYVK